MGLGAHSVRLTAELEWMESPLLCNLLQHSRLLKGRPREIRPLSSCRQQVLRHPRPPLQVSQSRMQEGKVTGRQRSTDGKGRKKGVGGKQGCWTRD